MVKKCGLLKIVHDHFKRTRQGEDPVLTEYIGSFEAAVESNKDIDGLISKNQVRFYMVPDSQSSCIHISSSIALNYTSDPDQGDSDECWQYWFCE